MTQTAAPAASAAPADPLTPSPSEVLAGLTAEQRATWEQTGDLPAPAPAGAPPAPPAADPPPAPPPAEVEETPASIDATYQRLNITAPPPGVSKRQHLVNELIRRETEAKLEVARLRGNLESRAGAPAADPTPPAPVSLPPDPSDPEPQLEQFADDADPYAAHLRAHLRWELRQEQRLARLAETQHAATADLHARFAKWVERRDAFAQTTPAFTAKALPFIATLFPNTPIGDTVMDSPMGPQLALHLAEHPEDVARIGALQPLQQLRELGKIEARLEAAVPAPPAAPAAEPPPPAKTVSDAPPPPPTLGANPTDPTDPADAALQRGDFRAYEHEMNRRELAGRR